MRPAWRIEADGEVLSGPGAAQLVSLQVIDRAGVEADALSLVIDNQGGMIAPPRRGVTLAAWLGFEETGLTKMGEFIVDHVGTAGPVQTIEIEAAALDLRIGARSPKTRPWKDVTLGQIAETIAGEHDLAPRVAEDLAAIEYKHLSQTGESDVHFLTRLGEEVGATVKVAEGRLIIAPRAAGQTVSGQALPTLSVARSEFTEWKASEGDRRTYKSCVSYWQNRDAAEKTEVIAGDGDPRFEIRRPYPTEAAARRAAEARLKRLNQSTRRLTGDLAVARPEMRAEQPLTTSGLDDMADGRWITTSVIHRLDGALTTKFEAEPFS